VRLSIITPGEKASLCLLSTSLLHPFLRSVMSISIHVPLLVTDLRGLGKGEAYLVLALGGNWDAF
jgi:hypothetical protein